MMGVLGKEKEGLDKLQPLSGVGLSSVHIERSPPVVDLSEVLVNQPSRRQRLRSLSAPGRDGLGLEVGSLGREGDGVKDGLGRDELDVGEVSLQKE